MTLSLSPAFSQVTVIKHWYSALFGKHAAHSDTLKTKSDTLAMKKTAKQDTTAHPQKTGLQKDSALVKNKLSGSIAKDTLLAKKTLSGIDNSLVKSVTSPVNAIASSKNKLMGLVPSDSLALQKKLLGQNKSSGTISAGYDYGVLPFATGRTYPSGYFKAQGQINFELAKLPFNSSFFYSDMNSVSGLTNYFKISFDAKKYRDQMRGQFKGKEDDLQNQVTQLTNEKQAVEKQLDYLKSVNVDQYYTDAEKQMSKYTAQLKQMDHIQTPSANTLGLNSKLDNAVKDSLNLIKSPAKPNLNASDSLKLPSTPKQNSLPADSLSPKTSPKPALSQTDSLNRQKKLYRDSINYYIRQVRRIDSIPGKIKEYEGKIQKYESEIGKAQGTIATLKKSGKNVNGFNPYTKGWAKILSSVKKFELGLCNPDYSTYLVSGITLKGVNLELENDNYFFAFTYGKTVNTLLFTNNAVQNSLVNTKNLYNYFDFNNLTNGRRVAALKFGLGKMAGNHLYIGFLNGEGLNSYTTNYTSFTDGALASYTEKNYVVEIDGKLAFDPKNNLTLVYGKSYMQQNVIASEQPSTGFTSATQADHSNAAMLKYTSDITKTKTKITLTTRLIQPFFNSFGVGFMSSDDFRYELKAEQTLSSKLKLTVSYKKDQDNLLALFAYKTTLYTLGTNLTAKLNRYFTLRVAYNPVVQDITSQDNTYHASNKNNISNAIVSYTPKVKNFNSTFNLAYSYYNLSSDSVHNVMQSVIINNVSQFKNSFQNTCAISWFYTNHTDSINSNTLLLSDNVSYKLKNGVSFTLGLKLAQNNIYHTQLGYLGKLDVPLVKKLTAEASFEKIVIGDFYNNYNIAQIERFPYFCSMKLIYHW